MQRLIAITPPKVHTVWGLLSAILDPGVPVLTTTDLDVVRSVERCGDSQVIGFMSTYSGCPVTEHLLGEIRAVMADHDYTSVHTTLRLDPPWTIDWMSPSARGRLRQYGISPPQAHTCHVEMPADVQCPCYASTHISLISKFDSMACETLYHCGSCREPLDYFRYI